MSATASATAAHGRQRRTSTALDVDALIADPSTRIVVCCGAGGVGKTTVAASLGLRAAEQGRRGVVLTIDPARRPAPAMGLARLDKTPREGNDLDTPAGGPPGPVEPPHKSPPPQ